MKLEKIIDEMPPALIAISLLGCLVLNLLIVLAKSVACVFIGVTILRAFGFHI